MSSFWDKTNFKSPLAKILGHLGLIKANPNITITEKYFSESNKSFLTYRVLGRNVMVLGDPVGSYQEVEELIYSFYQKVRSQNQSLYFFQTSSFFLDIYKKLDLRISTIGNEGFVNLLNFDLKNPNRTDLREQMRTLDAFRYKVRYYKNPTDTTLLQKLEKVSSDWSVGLTTVMTVEDMVGNIVAFINLVPSYKRSDLGIDLIRESKTAPEGTLEYLLAHSVLFFKELGYQRLSLGLIPLNTSEAKPNFQEAVTKALLAKMSFLFSDISLKPLKEKFVDILEPRYFISSKQQKTTTSNTYKANFVVK